MSTTFTTITQGLDMNSVAAGALLKEIIEAYRERYNLTKHADDPTILAPADWVGKDFLNSNFVEFSDLTTLRSIHLSIAYWTGLYIGGMIGDTGGQVLAVVKDNNESFDPEGQSVIDTYITEADLQDFFTTAGMTDGSRTGWRWARIYDPNINDWTDHEDDMYTQDLVYEPTHLDADGDGNVQYDGGIGYDGDNASPHSDDDLPSKGHIYGAWILDDYQKALTNIRWSLQRLLGGDTEWQLWDARGADAVCQDARDLCESRYGPPTTDPYSYPYHVWRSVTSVAGKFSFETVRFKAKITDAFEAVVDYDYDLYAKPQVWVGLELPWTINVHNLVESGTRTAGNRFLSAYHLGDSDGAKTLFPFDIAPAITCPLTPPEVDTDRVTLGELDLIRKGDFTLSGQ